MKGEKRQEKEDKDEHHHRLERVRDVHALVPAAGNRRRRRRQGQLQDGLLTITLPKTPTAKATTIPIKPA